MYRNWTYPLGQDFGVDVGYEFGEHFISRRRCRRHGNGNSMKQFSCGDVVPGCSAQFQASDEAELLQQIARHAREDHGLTDLPADLVEAVKKNIHSTRNA